MLNLTEGQVKKAVTDYLEYAMNQGKLGKLPVSKESEVNKYHAKRTYSELCQRTFDSKAECHRGEELRMLEMAGEITDLRYQVKFTLSDKLYKVTITIDFTYLLNGIRVFEDTKGILTRDFRTKLAWLKQLLGIDVLLTK